MQFQKYINHNTNRGGSKTVSSSKKVIQHKPRVIKFVGNMEENIKQLMHGINCHCGNKKQFYNILVVFASKIEKLRTQREHYKNTLKQYLLTMNNNNNNAMKTKNLSTSKNVKTKTINESKDNLINNEDRIESYQSTNNSVQIKIKQNVSPLTKVANLFQNQNVNKSNNKFSGNSDNHFLKQNKTKSSLQDRNTFTAIKKPLFQNTTPMKQIKTADKRMSHFYQTNIKPNYQTQIQDQCQFSLNLSSFDDINQQKQTSDFMKEVSSIMSETNLLDSDDEEQSNLTFTLNQNKTRSSQKISDLQEKVNKLRMLKQSTNFQDILLSLNDDDQKIQMKSLQRKNMLKKKQNPEDLTIQKKSVKKVQKINDKENVKAQMSLKKFNITIQKLENFIQNKECLKQLQKTQNYDLNINNYKTISSCSLQKDVSKDFELVKKPFRGMGRALEQKKININF